MNRRVYAALIASSLLAVSGCLTAESKLNADNSGSMRISYPIAPKSIEAAKKKFEGPHVKVVRTGFRDERGVFDLTFDDARQLNTSKFFENVDVTIADAGGNKDLTVKIVNKKTHKLNDEAIAKLGKEMRISIALPGEAVASNAQSTQGSIVTWVITTYDFNNAPETILKATYKNPEPAASPAAGAPASKPSGAS